MELRNLGAPASQPAQQSNQQQAVLRLETPPKELSRKNAGLGLHKNGLARSSRSAAKKPFLPLDDRRHLLQATHRHGVLAATCALDNLVLPFSSLGFDRLDCFTSVNRRDEQAKGPHLQLLLIAHDRTAANSACQGCTRALCKDSGLMISAPALIVSTGRHLSTRPSPMSSNQIARVPTSPEGHPMGANEGSLAKDTNTNHRYRHDI